MSKTIEAVIEEKVVVTKQVCTRFVCDGCGREAEYPMTISLSGVALV